MINYFFVRDNLSLVAFQYCTIDTKYIFLGHLYIHDAATIPSEKFMHCIHSIPMTLNMYTFDPMFIITGAFYVLPCELNNQVLINGVITIHIELPAPPMFVCILHFRTIW